MFIFPYNRKCLFFHIIRSSIICILEAEEPLDLDLIDILFNQSQHKHVSLDIKCIGQCEISHITELLHVYIHSFFWLFKITYTL